MAIIELATENMVQAILDITVNQGIDPSRAVLVGGGGAAGLNSVLIARRLESPCLLIPEVGAAMSAAGAMMSGLTTQFRTTRFTSSDRFERRSVNALIADLREQCAGFIAGPGKDARSASIRHWVEARYAEQIWEIEVEIPDDAIGDDVNVDALVNAFHEAHEQIFAFRDAGAAVEFVTWGATVSCVIAKNKRARLQSPAAVHVATGSRRTYFPATGFVDSQVKRFEAMAVGEVVHGPAIIESSFTTIVLNPGAIARRRPSGSLSITPSIP